MQKPEFLPFSTSEFTQQQALQAGAYILFLEVSNSPQGIPIEQIYVELTGRYGGLGFEDAVQSQIVSKVGRTLSAFVGSKKFDPRTTIDNILTRLS